MTQKPTERRKTRVVIGLLGTTLDAAGKTPARWERWRPTVSLCQHEDLVIDRLELLMQKRYKALADLVTADIRSCSPETTVRQTHVELTDPWDFEAVYAALHDFSRSYAFDTDNEEYLIHITTGTHVAQICLFLLTEARYLPGTLIQTGPAGRGDKAAGSWRVIDLDLSKYDALASRFRREHQDAARHLKSGIETRNLTFNRLIERIETVAMRSRAPILLMGPTGAGKSHLARRVYEIKKHRALVDGGFIEVNCATLRGDGAMSTLFGHIKGAFTGAQKDRDGLLRAAHHGVLFLDEIGELGGDEQAMLLRALEDKRFFPVGADREVASDFQLIAGTNRDLRADVDAGRFRDDLLARINLWTFDLPGLAGRREDIEPNLDYELERFAAASGQRVRFNQEARRRYLAFALSPAAAWRGNFRDLNASITRMATLAPGGRITEAIVEEELDNLRAQGRGGVDAGSAASVLEALGIGPLDRFDRVQLADVVAVCRASASLAEAGRTLFAQSRQARHSINDGDRLRKYLAKFGLSWQSIRGT